MKYCKKPKFLGLSFVIEKKVWVAEVKIPNNPKFHFSKIVFLECFEFVTPGTHTFQIQ